MKWKLTDRKIARFIVCFLTGFLLSSVSSTVWMQNLDANETLGGKKTREEQLKNAACCFEQILEAALYKTESAQPLTSYLTNPRSKTNKTCWLLLWK